MHPSRIALIFVVLLSFSTVSAITIPKEYPLSWDVWYHLRISRQFSEGQFTWDSGSFGPQGRPHTYPPVFHVVTALLHRGSGLPLETLARILPPFLVTLSILALYLLTRTLFDEKVAISSSLLAAVCPLFLDRAVSYTPELLALILFNLGLYTFYQQKWVLSGVISGLLVLTHGLSSAAFIAVIFIYTFFSLVILRKNYLKHFLGVILLTLVISVPWGLSHAPVFFPKGFAYPLELYPEKLGFVIMVLAFLGAVFLSRNRETVFLLSGTGSLFLLSQGSPSLPYRFTEFLVFPVVILAGVSLSRISRYWVLVPLFLLAFAQSYWVIEPYHPVVTTEQAQSYSWLSSSSVSGSTVICEWRTAPVMAFFSHTPPVKGAYQFGAPDLVKRTADTTTFYTDHVTSILQTYNVSFIYYGPEERVLYSEPPFNRVYATAETAFYHQ
ncbi:MAG: glycosyltransferase family 39 protein [Theionarchaea archaeon]|nr:glycosyltransferase family 39 protein [Theionarchaea archaeon]MBU7036538.1 glycosyltransferase family 39 protein [Theionarchaea archaeon]